MPSGLIIAEMGGHASFLNDRRSISFTDAIESRRMGRFCTLPRLPPAIADLRAAGPVRVISLLHYFRHLLRPSGELRTIRIASPFTLTPGAGA